MYAEKLNIARPVVIVSLVHGFQYSLTERGVCNIILTENIGRKFNDTRLVVEERTNFPQTCLFTCARVCFIPNALLKI